LVGNKITVIAGMLYIIKLGYTSRVSELLEQVEKLEKLGNKPFEIIEENPIKKEDFNDSVEMHKWLGEWKSRCDKIHTENKKPPSRHSIEGKIN
jgi:hypothetical protein